MMSIYPRLLMTYHRCRLKIQDWQKLYDQNKEQKTLYVITFIQTMQHYAWNMGCYPIRADTHMTSMKIF